MGELLAATQLLKERGLIQPALNLHVLLGFHADGKR
jgi:hypothetical protein